MPERDDMATLSNDASRTPHAMTIPPQDAGDAYGYAEALDLVHRGRFDQARDRARAATANAGAGAKAGTLSDLMASAMTELLADLPDNGFYPYPQELEDRAAAIIDIALAAGRPAWAAAVRGIQSAGITAMGRPDDAYGQLALGEAELAEEVARGGADPLGKPQGIAAAHNNLGYAYLLLEAFELALPHLLEASAISRWGYGPALSVQAEMDVFNLGELHLRWAMHLEANGEPGGCAEQAELAVDAAQTLTRGPTIPSDSPWADAAIVLTTGARLLTDPTSVSETDLEALQRPAQGDGASFLRSLTCCLEARAARLLGRSQAARHAADRLEAACSRFDPLLVRCAARDAELAEINEPEAFARVTAAHHAEALQNEQQRQAMLNTLRARIAASGQ